MYDKLLKPWKSFRITLYFLSCLTSVCLFPFSRFSHRNQHSPPLYLTLSTHESPLNSLGYKSFKSRHWLLFAVKANKLAGLDPRAQCFLLTSPSVLIQTAFLMIQCDFYCCSISPHFLLYGPQQYTTKNKNNNPSYCYIEIYSCNICEKSVTSLPIIAWKNSRYVLNHELTPAEQKFSVLAHMQEEGASENTGKEKT